MLRFVLRRCALVVPSLLGLLVVTFLLIHAVPSDPAVAMAGDAATPEQIERLRKQYGLDRPIWEQFAVYLDKVAHLDFGESAFSRRPVALDIAQRLPATLELTFFALAISVWSACRWASLGRSTTIAARTICCASSLCWASPWPPSGSPSCCSSCFPCSSAGCRCAAISSPP
jgi:ABC-type dipeptide/oligopeptide/nickel transport system permease component